MTDTRLIRRYSAYFHGWAQAFGAHERLDDPSGGLRWLLGEQQLGLILTAAMQPLLDALQIDGEERSAPGSNPARLAGARPAVSLDERALRVGGLILPLDRARQAVIERARALLDDQPDLHLYQTYHLIYPSGTRILTLSQRAPMTLIYRELEPLRISRPLVPVEPPA
jgi:hypothetical protein